MKTLLPRLRQILHNDLASGVKPLVKIVQVRPRQWIESQLNTGLQIPGIFIWPQSKSLAPDVSVGDLRENLQVAIMILVATLKQDQDALLFGDRGLFTIHDAIFDCLEDNKKLRLVTPAGPDNQYTEQSNCDVDGFELPYETQFFEFDFGQTSKGVGEVSLLKFYRRSIPWFETENNVSSFPEGSEPRKFM